MTAATKTTIKTYFETNDTPTQSQFSDFIDSCLFIANDTSQIVSGAVNFVGSFQISGNTLATTAFVTPTSGALLGANTSGAVGSITVGSGLTLSGATLSTTGGGSGTLITTAIVSAGQTTVDFTTGIDSTYAHYWVEISNLVPATDVQDLYMRFQQGGSFITTSNYSWSHNAYATGGTDYSTGQAAVGAIHITQQGIHNATTTPANGVVHFFRPDLAAQLEVVTKFYANNGTTSVCYNGGGVLNLTAVTSGIRFYMGSGNITSGTFKLYGV